MSRPILVAPLTYIGVVAPRRDNSCGRAADKCGLRTWTINLRAWIFGFTYLVFKTTCVDRRIPLQEGVFFFTRRTLSPPLGMGRTALPFFAEEGKDFGKGVVLSGGLGLSVAADQVAEGTPQRTKVPHTARGDFALLTYQRAAIAP